MRLYIFNYQHMTDHSHMIMSHSHTDKMVGRTGLHPFLKKFVSSVLSLEQMCLFNVYFYCDKICSIGPVPHEQHSIYSLTKFRAHL